MAWAVLWTKGATWCRVDPLDRPGDRHGGDGSSRVAQGRGDARQTLVGLLVVEREPIGGRALEVGDELCRRRDGAGRAAGEVVVDDVLGRVGVVGQHRLAQAGAVGGLPATLAGGHPEVGGHDAVEIDHLGSVEDAELDRESGLRRQRVEVGRGRLGEPAAPGCQTTDLEQAHADAVALEVPFEPAHLAQLLDHAVDRRLGQLGAEGELVQGEHLVGVVERAEDAVDPSQHRSPSVLGQRSRSFTVHGPPRVVIDRWSTI